MDNSEKTFVFIDVINIKKLLKTNRDQATSLLELFWREIKNITDNPGCFFKEPIYCGNNIYISYPHFKCFTFSDTAVFIFDNDIPVQSIINYCVTVIFNRLKNIGIEVYMIVSFGTDIEFNDDFSGTMYRGGYANNPNYVHVCGSGDVWTNIFEVENFLKVKGKEEKEELYSKYNIYSIGIEKKDLVQWNELNSEKKIFAKKI